MAENKAENTKKKKEETVTIRLPRERKDQDDKIVWVNEKRYLIKRGEDVEVPVSVAQILQHEEDMLRDAYNFEDGLNK